MAWHTSRLDGTPCQTYDEHVRAGFFVLMIALAACSHDPPDAIPNVRLGMAPRDVRDRFHPGGTDPGSWQTALGTGDDTVLEWTSHDPKAPIADARFEFHLGMLVAIRAKSHEHVAREEVTTTAKTVTVKSPTDTGATITVLARDCPTHKDEADAFATKAR